MSGYILELILGTIIFLAGMLQGMTSFGFALLAMPLLALFIPLKSVVPMVVILCLITNIIVLLRGKSYRYPDMKRAVPLIIYSIMGLPLGTLALLAADENELKLATGIIIILSAASLLTGFKVNIRDERLSYLPVGFLSGLLNSSISLSSPPVVLFFANQGIDKRVFRATLTVFFAVLNIITSASFVLGGLIGYEELKYVGFSLPSLGTGVLLGVWISNRVGELFFKRFTLILIIVMGIITAATGIGNI